MTGKVGYKRCTKSNAYFAALPTTRAFVSHCGMNGVMEAVYHKVGEINE